MSPEQQQVYGVIFLVLLLAVGIGGLLVGLAESRESQEEAGQKWL